MVYLAWDGDSYSVLLLDACCFRYCSWQLCLSHSAFFFLPTELTDLPLPPLLFFIFQQPSLVLYTDFVLPEFMFVPDSLLGIQCGQWSESLCANHILFLDVYHTRRPPLHFTYHMLAHKERGFHAGEISSSLFRGLL